MANLFLTEKERIKKEIEAIDYAYVTLRRDIDALLKLSDVANDYVQDTESYDYPGVREVFHTIVTQLSIKGEELDSLCLKRHKYENALKKLES